MTEDWYPLVPKTVVDITTRSIDRRSFSGWVNGWVLGRTVWRVGLSSGRRSVFQIVPPFRSFPLWWR